MTTNSTGVHNRFGDNVLGGYANSCIFGCLSEVKTPHSFTDHAGGACMVRRVHYIIHFTNDITHLFSAAHPFRSVTNVLFEFVSTHMEQHIDTKQTRKQALV